MRFQRLVEPDAGRALCYHFKELSLYSVKARSLHPVTPSAPPIPTACDGDGEPGCYRVAGDAA